MRLSRTLETSCMARVQGDPHKLYSVVAEELRRGVKSKGSAEYYKLLWSEVSPAGNIYRYNGLVAERRKHCEDLQKQVAQIADEFAHVFGEEASDRRERIKMLIEALEQVQTHGAMPKQAEFLEAPPCLGFPPLQEYMYDEVERIGPLLVPGDPESRSLHRRAVGIALFIFAIQILAPGLVLVNRWQYKTNYLKSPLTLWSNLTLAEAFCLGATMTQQFTTIMGVCFLTVIIFVVRLYIIDEIENAEKSKRLPTDPWWFTVGIIGNMCCCVFTILCIPLLFWSEDTPTNIVLDSMTLLFVFRLDDLSDAMGGFLRMSDNDFQRVVSWNFALLAQCPVRVKDLINPDASSIRDLWHIKFDSDGRLLAAPQTGCDLPKICETRLSPIHQSETSKLLCHTSSDSGDMNSADAKFQYCRSGDHAMVLPSLWQSFLYVGWHAIDKFTLLLQFLVPPLWFVVNKPCYAAKP